MKLFGKKSMLAAAIAAVTVCLLVQAQAAPDKPGLEVYVSPKGANQNSGTKQSPLTLAGAIHKTRGVIKEKGLPEGGVTIYLLGGQYEIERGLTLGKEFKGTKESPIVIRNYPGDTVLFDGGKHIQLMGFTPVTDSKEKARLAKLAQDKIIAKTITDPVLIKKLKSAVVLNLGIDNEIYLPSCYPNSGYAVLAKEYAVKEVSPPAVPPTKTEKQAGRAGSPPWQESGKKRGWKGSITEPRGAQVGIGKRENEMAGTWSQWADEINGNNTRNLLTGFISADWLLESHPIYAANAQAKTIHLSRAVAYGWHGAKHERKDFKVYGLLCELDQPGEWHFDTRSNRFYIYPPKPMSTIKQMGFPYAKDFLTLKGTEHVSIIGLNVQNLGSGTVFNVHGGHYNLIAGCKINNCTAKGISLNGGTHNGASGCDLVDLRSHVSIGGGRRGPAEITPAYNYVENCHMYQVKFNHEKVGISLGGVGNIFTNNLVHNSIGQAMMIGGNDHQIERNEMFNIGYDEGDGGAMYAGADLAGYGNLYRHNFFHHLIHVPGKVTRAGIHLDDLQAGATLTGNVFFKSAQKGIFMNAGSGNVIKDNVLLEGSLGIYNVGVGSEKSYNRQNEIDANPDHDLKGNKEDYVGRCEKLVGKDGWNKDPWLTKYPRFALVMNDKGKHGRMWPIRNVLDGNMYYGNDRGDHAVWSRFSPQSEAKTVITNEKVISPDYFVDYDKMDFRFKKQAHDTPEIPFEKIGLYLDEYRTSMPDKQYYRNEIREFFREIKSMPGSNEQINTGRVVEKAPVIKAK